MSSLGKGKTGICSAADSSTSGPALCRFSARSKHDGRGASRARAEHDRVLPLAPGAYALLGRVSDAVLKKGMDIALEGCLVHLPTSRVAILPSRSISNVIGIEVRPVSRLATSSLPRTTGYLSLCSARNGSTDFQPSSSIETPMTMSLDPVFYSGIPCTRESPPCIPRTRWPKNREAQPGLCSPTISPGRLWSQAE